MVSAMMFGGNRQQERVAMSFQLDEILKWTGGEIINSKEEVPLVFEHIGMDSRTTRPGELFVALKGKNFDGHDFIGSAFSKGAKAALVSKIPEEQSHYPGENKFFLIKVKDTLQALQDMATNYRHKFNLKVIAVTGSNGKTTTKDLITHLLKNKYSVIKSEGNFNNHIGLPLSLLSIGDNHQIAVLELGMSALGEIKLLSQIAKPEFGVITNVSPAHLEFLGSLDNVATAKSELIEFLSAESISFLNNDDPYVSQMRNKAKGKVITFGIKEKADYRADDIDYSHQGLSFKINQDVTISVPLLGHHNIYNVLAACAVARVLDLNWEIIKDCLANFSPPPMRMEFLEIKGLNIINDAYNANPHSVRVAIDTLKDFKTVGRKIMILGDMLELGNSSSLFHKQLGEYIANKGIDYLLTVGDVSRLTSQSALESGMDAGHIFHCNSIEEILVILKDIVQSEDVILIKASRAMRLERIVEGIKNAL